MSQQRHWRLQQDQPTSAALNIAFLLRLEGALDIRALESALRELLVRHGSLRARFSTRGGELWVDEAQLDDWRLPLGEAADLDTARLSLAEEAHRPFDLEREVFRAQLLRTPDGVATLGLAFHHIVFDGWSFNVFFGELAALYNARCSDGPPPLLEPAVPYAEFARRQRAEASSGAWEPELAHWRRELEGAKPSVLPRDLDPGPPPNHTALAALRLTPRSSSELGEAARRLRVIPFAPLLAAYFAVLSRWLDQTDVTAGTPFLGRHDPDWKRTVGLFVNTVPLRADLAGDPSLADLARRAHATLIDSHRHQSLPLDRIMAAAEMPSSFSGGLYTTLVQIQSANSDIPPLHDLRFALTPVWNPHAKYDLLVSLGPHGGAMVGLFEYNADAFREETIARFVSDYACALAAACLAPDLRLSGLDAALAGAPRLEFEPTTAADLPTLRVRTISAAAELTDLLELPAGGPAGPPIRR